MFASARATSGASTAASPISLEHDKPLARRRRGHAGCIGFDLGRRGPWKLLAVLLPRDGAPEVSFGKASLPPEARLACAPRRLRFG